MADRRKEDLGDLIEELSVGFALAGELKYREYQGKLFFAASERLANAAAHAIALHRLRIKFGNPTISYQEAMAMSPDLGRRILASARLGDFYQWSWLSGQLTETAAKWLLTRCQQAK